MVAIFFASEIPPHRRVEHDDPGRSRFHEIAEGPRVASVSTRRAARGCRRVALRLESKSHLDGVSCQKVARARVPGRSGCGRQLHMEWNSTMMSIGVADALADLLEGLQRLRRSGPEIYWPPLFSAAISNGQISWQ